MNCPVCSAQSTVIGEAVDFVSSKLVGISWCPHCDLKFAPIERTREIYDELYSSGKLGYHHDKTKDNLSLRKLINKDVSFTAVYDNLPDSKHLDILDVGCSYGYLTNALRKLGHNAKGIDVSAQAIDYSRKIYGDFFDTKEVESVKGSFDMIIAIELIEHLTDPLKFVKKCAELLKPGGKLIITTPNKDFYSRKTVWMTNPPPVHNYWFGGRTMEVMAKSAGLKMELLPHHKYLMRYDNQNLLVNWIRYRNQKQGIFSLKPSTAKRGFIKTVLRSIVLSKPVKEVSNFLFSLRPVTRTLAVMMTKT